MEEFLSAITKKRFFIYYKKKNKNEKSSDGKWINFEEFLDYYHDVNATLPTDKEEYFIDVKNQLIFFN